jgi:hypothetical protein
MIRRALLVGLLALAAGVSPAQGGPASASPSYLLARADPRLCPSPMCGGIWVRAVNAGETVCGGDVRQKECYAAAADLSRIRVDAKGRELLQRAISEGRAVARGRLVRGRVAGFPELDTLLVSEVWTASSSQARAAGVFRRLRDNGIRCVKAPCFWIATTVLNSSRSLSASSIDLSRVGAAPAERRRALEQLSGPGLIAAGRMVRTADRGRTFVATQFYVRAEG